VTLQQQLACATRELALRQRVYPKQVAMGKMAEAQAAYEQKCMYAIVETLTQLIEQRQERQPSLFGPGVHSQDAWRQADAHS
jgi:hypothetical protein